LAFGAFDTITIIQGRKQFEFTITITALIFVNRHKKISFEPLSKVLYQNILYFDFTQIKKSKKINRFKFWGLAIFVCIPLSGTGAWTGCLEANI